MREAARKYWISPDGCGVAPYVERPDVKVNLVDRHLTAVFSGLRSRLTPRTMVAAGLAGRVMQVSASLEDVTDEELAARAEALCPQLLRQGFAPPLVVRSFALLREATRRTLGIAHRRVQIRGAQLLLKGALLEMATGEGKTITALLAAGTAALAGRMVHVITVNDYLAERDYTDLTPVYQRLGLTTGLVVNGMAPPERRAAYRAEIVYVNNKEVAFDYLRDRLALGTRRSRARAKIMAAFGESGNEATTPMLTLRGLDFAVVDEADSVLIDEAKTPLIISSQSARPEDPEEYLRALDIAASLAIGVDFELLAKERAPRLKPAGRRRIAERATGLKGLWAVRRARDERIVQALSALHVFKRDQHYIVADDKVQFVDEFTGRVMPDRSWEAGLHQMVEAKEGVPLTGRRSTIARITYQRFFRRYRHLSGMTGTGMEVSGEMDAEFRLKTVSVPTHRPVIRRFLGARLYRSAEQKWAAVVRSVAEAAGAGGHPVLIGMRSVEASEALSTALSVAGLDHVVLNARQDADEAEVVAHAGQRGAITVATNMAGRGTDIRLGEGVAALGGLHVILTEFHESARIDRQLYGRAGRQGDPGSCEAIVAADDELFVRFAPRLQRLVSKLPAAPDGEMPAVLATLMRRVGQSRAEWVNAATRRIYLKQGRDMERALAFSGKPE